MRTVQTGPTSVSSEDLFYQIPKWCNKRKSLFPILRTSAVQSQYSQLCARSRGFKSRLGQTFLMNIPNMIMLFSGSPRLGKVNVHIGASVSIPSEWKVNPPYGNLFVCITCILDTYTFHFPFRGKCKKGLPCQIWILKYSNYLKMTSFQDWHELFKWIKQE